MSEVNGAGVKIKICTVKNPNEFFADIENEIVSENPDQKYHLGKYLLKAMRKHPRDATSQIDATSGEMETFGSMLDRSILTAQAFQSFQLGVGDIVAVIGANHLDVVIPFFACLFTGVTFMGIDTNYNKAQMLRIIKLTKPKIIFSDSEFLSNLEEINIQIDFKLVSFKGNSDVQTNNYQNFLHENQTKESLNEFKTTEFDPATTTAAICITSGSTGTPKLVELTHKNLAPKLTMPWAVLHTIPDTLIVGTISPIFWVTASDFNLYSAMYCLTRVQSSKVTPSHIVQMVNKYRPAVLAMPPQIAQILLKFPMEMDWTCFHTFVLCGAGVEEDVIEAINSKIGRLTVKCMYGITETAGNVFYLADNKGSLGVPLPFLKAKLIDPETMEEIIEDECSGELWIKGQTVFKGYYNDLDSTKAVMTAGGWYKTGDVFKRDGNKHYQFLERLNNLLYTMVEGRRYKVSPNEIEKIIKRMQDVEDVVVAGKHQDEISHPVAVVVKAKNSELTEDDIINHVAEYSSREKHLTGGVQFIDAIPLLPTGKYNRLTVELMVNMPDEKPGDVEDIIDITRKTKKRI